MSSLGEAGRTIGNGNGKCFQGSHSHCRIGSGYSNKSGSTAASRSQSRSNSQIGKELNDFIREANGVSNIREANGVSFIREANGVSNTGNMNVGGVTTGSMGVRSQSSSNRSGNNGSRQRKNEVGWENQTAPPGMAGLQQQQGLGMGVNNMGLTNYTSDDQGKRSHSRIRSLPANFFAEAPEKWKAYALQKPAEYLGSLG